MTVNRGYIRRQVWVRSHMRANAIERVVYIIMRGFCYIHSSIQKQGRERKAASLLHEARSAARKVLRILEGF